MSDGSIWKKEISFKRKPKAGAEPEPQTADEVVESDAKPASVWKKEISFKRKPKAGAEPEPQTTDEVVESDAKPASVWRKEISFKRKPKAGAEPEAQTTDEVVESDAKPALWKKEISFKRKPKAAADETAATTQPQQSLWKKEISFGRKRSLPVEVETEVEREPGPEAQLDAPVAAAAPDSVDAGEVAPELAAMSAPEQQPEPQSAAPDHPWPTIAEADSAPSLEAEADSPPTALEPAAAQGPTLEAVPEPTHFLEAVPDPEPAEGPVVEALPDPVELAAVPEPLAEDVVAETSAVDVGAWTEAPELPPEPMPVEAPADPVADAETFEAPAPAVHVPMPPPVVHPPVPAAELPPVPEPGAEKPEKAVPFWKREISLGGRSKSKADKGESPARGKKAQKPKKEKKAKAPRVKAERGSRGGKKLVGLKVGASQLAAARVSNNGSAELLQVAREPLSPGIVVGGELRDPDALTTALKDFFAKNKLPKRSVRLGIANNRIGVRTLELGGIDDLKQLDNAIRFRAQEALPIPIDEAVLDYQVLGEATDDQGQVVRRILLVVAYREQIDRYVDACRKAGITLVGIDLEAFALLRALQAPLENVPEDASALVGVAIGHERSTFAVSDGRVCEFTRVLEWGGSALNVALARALDAAPSEVEHVKRTLSLIDESVPDGLDADQSAKARDAVRRAVQSFARELVSSLQFYQNQPGSLGIGEIVLTGGTAHLPGLAVELERMIGVHVRIGDPLARVKVSKRVGEPEQIGSFAVAIGLGIED